MFCTKCGLELPDGTVFCTSCGAKQEQAAAESEDLQSQGTNEQKILRKWSFPKKGTAASGQTPSGKQKKRGKIIGISMAVVAVVVLAVGAVVLNQPKIKLIRCAYQTYRDMVKTESGVEQYLGLKDIVKMVQTGKTHQELTFAGKQDGERFGIRAVLNMDKKSGETAGLAYPMYKNSELTELLMYRNQERTVIAAPDLYDGSFYFRNEDMIRNFRDSALNAYIEQRIGRHGGEDSMSNEDWEALDGLMNRFIAQSSDTWKQMGKNITVEKTDSKNFTIGGKSKKCAGYEVTIPKKDMKNVLKVVAKFAEKDNSIKKIIISMPGMGERDYELFLRELDEMMSDLESTLEDDLVMILYTGPKGRLISMEGEYKFALSRHEIPLSLTVSLLGTGNPLDMVELECDYTNTIAWDGSQQSDRYTISVLREQTYNKSSKQLDDSGEITVKNIWNNNVYTDKMSYGFSLNQKSGAWDLSLKADDDTVKADGTISDVIKGKGFTLVLDKLKFDSSYMPTFEGQYVVGTLGKETMNVIPEDLGEEIDLFDMGMSEVQRVGEGVIKKLRQALPMPIWNFLREL